MLDYRNFFKNKRVTIMGLGLLGRGVGDAIFLALSGAKLTITDLKSTAELKPSLKKLRKFKNIKYILGKHRLADFKNTDMILKAAGVPINSPYIAYAKKHGILVEMSTALFARLSGATVVGVTGTRGKSTTTHLIYEILKHDGRRVHIGGNVRGVSTLALLPKVKPGDIAVLELDSWQLQGFGESSLSPHVAVFTNFFSDHLNYYKGDRKAYFKDKTNIFKYQKNNDFLIVGGQIAKILRKKLNTRAIKSKVITATPKLLPKRWKIKIKGKHNLENTALAVAATEALGVKETIIKQTLRKFKGIPGRLEFLKNFRGVSIYNDTTATTPEATLRALETLSKNKNIILIMGGADKSLNLEPLIKALPLYTRDILLLPGNGTDKWRKEIEKDKSLTVVKVSNLKQSLNEGIKMAKKGDILILSPAFASFGLFKNEFDRGEQFKRLVKKL